MNNTLYCPFCSQEEPFTIKKIKEVYPVKGENIEVESCVSVCCNCNNEIWNEEVDSQNIKNAFDLYRLRHGLLSSQQIKAIRDKYEISQSTFARALGLGEKTITRYERGSLQDRAHNGLIALADKPDAFRYLIEINKELLTPNELLSLRTKLEEFRVKTIENESAITVMNYSARAPYKIKSYNYFFGGLDNAG